MQTDIKNSPFGELFRYSFYILCTAILLHAEGLAVDIPELLKQLVAALMNVRFSAGLSLVRFVHPDQVYLI